MQMNGKVMRKTAEAAILTAIVVLLQLIGTTIRIGDFSISLNLLPVVVGAVLCGPLGSAWLGLVFGTVLMLTGEVDSFYAISPIHTVITTAGRGMLAGLSSGLVYRTVSKKGKDFAIVLASITAPVVNTGLFIVLCLLFFYDVFEEIMGVGQVFSGMIKSYVSINFLIELALSMLLPPLLIRLAMRIENRPSVKAAENINRKKLASRLTVTLVLLGILICTISSRSGYKNVMSSVEKQYGDTAYLIAETARSYLDDDFLRVCKAELKKVRAGKKSADELSQSIAYLDTLDLLANLREKMGADEINVFMPDPAGPAEGSSLPLTVLFDACGKEEKSIPFSRCVEAESEYAQLIDKGNFITRDENYDSAAAAVCLYDENTEDLLAVVSVSIPMMTMKSAVRNDITDSLVTMICIEIIFIILYFYYISYRVIEPIKSISEAVSSFVESEDRVSGALTEIRTRDEIQQLAEDIVRMEKDIGSYIANITAITAEQERISAELNVATKIQADMLPSRFPAFPDRADFDIFASMDPAKEVGGDFYDFFLLDNDHIALVIGDVSDKGVPAALFMVVAKTLIKNQASFTRSPKQILEAVNYQLWENNASKMFVTAWICIFEISTGHCVASNAGHEYPAIRRANGDFELVKDRHGFVLGGIKKSLYSEYEFQVEKGGTVFVYTDGVTEAINAEDEFFGTARMIDALNISSGGAAVEIVRNVKSSINEFVGNAPQFDDITMLCIKRT